jgi:transcriptional regulator with XRE-family HTH domain
MQAMDGKSVATRLVRDIRRRAGLTQRALAAKADVPQPTIAEIEAGRREPSMTLLSRLAEATGYELKLELEPLPPRGAVATANRIRDLLAGAEDDGLSPPQREDAALRAAIDFRNALASAGASDFTRLVATPPGLTGDTRWDAFIAAAVEDEAATRSVTGPRWTDERARFTRPLWYLSENRALHAWELATAPGAFVRHGVLAAREELESA